ncbi:SRPBCC family protein [Serinibacter arcticus]|uniref:SRPBCC family protein n=1 Tax=Serinibacter arcticus TaxID=1655435 RepID=A0A4Z1DYG9_9MICO|nr:SRPBCC family protein [Serinibacter arcticus]TGO03959.1 hypothetical protein SERN_2971 [Serinibacter arcticus]
MAPGRHARTSPSIATLVESRPPGSLSLTLRVRGPLPAEAVWERYADPSLWRAWGPYIRGVDGLGPRLRAATRGRVLGPLGVVADAVVAAVDEDARTWSWAARSGPFVLRLTHGVESVVLRDGASGTRAWLTVRGAPVVVLAYALPATLALTALVRRRVEQ